MITCSFKRRNGITYGSEVA